MQSNYFEVSIDRARRDSFVALSQAYTDGTLGPLFHGRLPPIVALRLTRPDGVDVYVGCLAERGHRQQKMKLLCSHALASDLGLADGALVRCAALTRVPRATWVLVAPVTVDDSEVVEQNALRIEAELLRQVQVVFPRQVVTVAIYPGVSATVHVQRIDCGEGNELAEGAGCAAMFEGTHFVVATRARTAEPGTCCWAVARGRPCAERQGKPGDCFLASERTAARYGWTEDALYRIIDMAAVAALEDGKITQTFLRSEAVKQAKLVIVEDTEVEGDIAVVVGASFLSQATNLLILPTTESGNSGSSEPVTAHVVKGPPPALSLAELAAVHSDAPRELLDYLEFALLRGEEEDAAAEAQLPHNILLCGGKGYGKTAIVSSVLRHLSGRVHSVVLECVSGRHLLSALRGALLECVLCAPAVLVLDGFDNIAPEQKEGNVQAMSAATQATLEAVLTRSRPVVVVGTCSSRESVHEALRSTWCFQKFISIDALRRSSRCALLAQLFPSAGRVEVGRMAALMDNYTPFDVRQISVRVRNAMATSPGSSLVATTEQVAAAFTPLAHTGIKFLKGDKLDWDSIGGLAEAKKALHDTLVLPMRHPKLFARLPLKTRSGILLYGASGCGKTFVLEALVKAENINCIVVNGPEVFGKYIGQSEQKIRDVFERAQAAAPCVVFFDEFDSVAPQRGVDNSGVTDRVVNQLLCYLDGVEGRKDVYVVAASSRPDLIDAALLRPGRLDKAVQCPVPSQADRVAILANLLRREQGQLPDGALERLAAATENWTPADLSAVASTASMLVSQRIMEHQKREGAAAGVVGSHEDTSFLIADVGAGVSRDKVVDALKVVLDGGRAASAATTMKSVTAGMTEADLTQAMGETRPSLSAKDIAKQQRIHALFSKNESLPTPNPGTKLTFS